MDKQLTAQIKQLAHSLGADLVGFANIERFEKAPPKMSPQGILPTAKTVIVCAVHHPDATIELEGGEHGDSQKMESYGVQMTMNNKLDHMSFVIAHYLDSKGYASVPIVSSNIWRYRSYKELTAVFSPDISHIYASVAAGLTEMGWNGIALSPEYGTRNRFVSVITDAALEPTPLYSGEKLCDMCGECIRCCPTDAYRKEVDGVKTIEIEDRVYKFANKNLWRCAWGEHFALDLDLKIPDVVDEKVILDTVREKGVRGGELGTCLKVCVPPKLRFRDPDYTPYNRRKRYFAPDDAPISRDIYDMMTRHMLTYHGDRVVIVSKEKAAAAGVDIAKKMKEAKTVILLSTRSTAPSATLPADAKWRSERDERGAAAMALTFAAYDISRELEKAGYSVLPHMWSIAKEYDKLVAADSDFKGTESRHAIVTSAPLEEKDWTLDGASDRAQDIKSALTEAALANGADMFGVAPAERVEALRRQLLPIKDGETILNARDKSTRFEAYAPEVTEGKRTILSPYQYIENAASVIVLGTHFNSAVSERAGKPPAEAVGPYIFSQFQVLREVEWAGLEVVKELRRRGYKAYMTHDLLGMGSFVGSPRGEYSSPFDGTLEACAAGLGQLTYNGNLFTDKYGINQRFLCIVTDAPVPADAVKANTIQQRRCDGCRKCVDACPMSALKLENKAELSIDGNVYAYVPLDTVYCQWTSRYALTNRDGYKYLGSVDDFLPKEKITKELLAETLPKRDRVIKGRPGTAEQCVTECPLSTDF